MDSFGGLLMRLKGDVLMYVTKPKEPNILSFTQNILTLFLIKSRCSSKFFIFFCIFYFEKQKSVFVHVQNRSINLQRISAYSQA
jgi:hypothetical protein